LRVQSALKVERVSMKDGSHTVCYVGYGPQALTIRTTGSYDTDLRLLPYGTQALTVRTTGSYRTNHRLLPYGTQALTIRNSGS